MLQNNPRIFAHSIGTSGLRRSSQWRPPNGRVVLLRRHAACVPRASASADAGSDAEPLPASLSDRVLRLRALEDYRSLLMSSDVLASATALTAAPGPAEAAMAAAARPVLDLLTAVMLIARHARPQLDASWCQGEVERIAAAVEARLPPSVTRYPLRLVKEVNKVLYEQEGFQGNAIDYYSPDNSCIDQVLKRKRGIPISLSLVYMAVASRIGLKMEPVNLPAHLMLRPLVERQPVSYADDGAAPSKDGLPGVSQPGGSRVHPEVEEAEAGSLGSDDANSSTSTGGSDSSSSSLSASGGPSSSSGGQEQQSRSGKQQPGEGLTPSAAGGASGAGGEQAEEEEDAPGLLVDAFHGGELCWLQDAEERLSNITGMQVVLDPRWASGASPPMNGGSFLLRWLNNLRQVYMLTSDAENALAILKYMRATLEAMQSQAAEQQQQQQRLGRGGSSGSSSGRVSGVPTALGPLIDITRDEGMCLYSMGRWAEAAEMLSSYLAAAPSAPDASGVEAVLEKVRAAQRAATAAAGAGDSGEEGAEGSS